MKGNDKSNNVRANCCPVLGLVSCQDESLRDGVKQSEGAKACDIPFENVQRTDSVHDVIA